MAKWMERLQKSGEHGLALRLRILKMIGKLQHYEVQLPAQDMNNDNTYRHAEMEVGIHQGFSTYTKNCRQSLNAERKKRITPNWLLNTKSSALK